MANPRGEFIAMLEQELIRERALCDRLAVTLEDAIQLLECRGYTVSSFTPTLSAYDNARKEG